MDSISPQLSACKCNDNIRYAPYIQPFTVIYSKRSQEHETGRKLIRNQQVSGSSPLAGSILFKNLAAADHREGTL